MFLLISLALFAVFVANVLSGAMTGTLFLSDVGEMLVLFAASIAFVVEILRREAAAKGGAESNNKTIKDHEREENHGS